MAQKFAVSFSASEIHLFDHQDVQIGHSFNMKVVGAFPSFPTPICTPNSDNLSQRYCLPNEQGSKHILNEN